MVATQQWSTGTLQGDFGTDQPAFTWNAEVNSWGQGVGVQANNIVQELDVHVKWKEGSRQQILTVSTLVYQSANTTSSTTGTGTGTTGRCAMTSSTTCPRSHPNRSTVPSPSWN